MNSPFRLLDLPPELRLRIYEKYYEGATISFTKGGHGEGKSLEQKLLFTPSFALERTCKKIRSECRDVRIKSTPAALETYGFESRPLVEMAERLKKNVHATQFHWILHHVTSLRFSRRLTVGNVSLEGCVSLFNLWPRLQRIDMGVLHRNLQYESFLRDDWGESASVNDNFARGALNKIICRYTPDSDFDVDDSLEEAEDAEWPKILRICMQYDWYGEGSSPELVTTHEFELEYQKPGYQGRWQLKHSEIVDDSV